MPAYRIVLQNRLMLLLLLALIPALALAAPTPPLAAAPVAQNAGQHTGGSFWQWKRPLPQGNTLYGVVCPTAQICYAVGDAGTIIKSSDGGKNWAALYAASEFQLQDISCIDAATCYVVGFKPYSVRGELQSAGSIIVKTGDGGKSWATLYTGLGQALYAVSCLDVNSCYAAGGYTSGFSSQAVVLKTLDGGRSWQEPKAGLVASTLLDITCLSTDLCYTVGHGALFKTDSGGRGWLNLPAPRPSGTFTGISCPDSEICYVMGSISTVKTTDGGATWVVLPQVQYSADITCPGTLTCYAVEHNSSSNNTVYRVFRTNDGGINWTIQTIPAIPGFFTFLESIACTDANSCIAVGDEGTILQTSDGGQSWSSPVSGGVTEFKFIECPTGTICYVGDQDGSLLKSVDSANSWQSLLLPEGAKIRALACPDADLCYGISNNITLLKTLDGGRNWATQYTNSSADLYALDCPDREVCYVSGSNGVVIKTSNGGQQWQARSSSISGLLASISCPTTLTCYASGRGAGTTWTKDGGQTWQLTSNLGGGDISCANADTCTVAGFSGGSATGFQGYSLHTFDGGASWKGAVTARIYAEFSVSSLAYAVSCPMPDTCIAVGDYGIIQQTSGADWTRRIVVSDDIFNSYVWVRHTRATGNQLNDISCPTETSCYAVGYGGTLLAGGRAYAAHLPLITGP